MFKWFDLILPPGHPSRAEGPISSQQTPKGRDIQAKLVGRNQSVGSTAQGEVELAEAHKAVTGSVMGNCNHLLTPSNNSGAARWKGIHVLPEQGNDFIHFLVVIKVPAQAAKGTRTL